MDMNSPEIKKIRGRFLAFLIIWLALEFFAFWGMSELIGGYYTVWLTIGIMILGYIIRPKEPLMKTPGIQDPSNFQEKLPKSYLPRKLASLFLMIPTFLTDIVAILVLITPVRRLLQRKLIQKLVPPSLAGLFTQGMPDMNSGAGSPFAGFGQNMGGLGQNDSDCSRKKSRYSDDIIDVDDYHVDGKKRDETRVEVERPYEYGKKRAPKALDAEVIDVEHEWK